MAKRKKRSKPDDVKELTDQLEKLANSVKMWLGEMVMGKMELGTCLVLGATVADAEKLVARIRGK